MGNISGLYECISCRRPVSFKHPGSQLLVCPSCNTPLQRDQQDKLVAKATLVIQSHNDIIKLGTTGNWQGKIFEVIGRVRYWLNDSVVNYWTLLTNDNKLYYLAESYGIYCILAMMDNNPAIELKSLKKAGDAVPVNNGSTATLEKMCTVIHLEVQGESWQLFHQTSLTFYDLSLSNGKYMTLATSSQGMLAFTVDHCSFNSLSLQNLEDRPQEPKIIKCPNCSGEQAIKTFPYAQSYGCSCGAKLQLEHTSVFRQFGRNPEQQLHQHIHLGKTGIIKGINYEVIGYAVKEDYTKYKSQWREYVLYNRQEGYAFLNEYDGHWIYSREKAEGPAQANTKDTRHFTYNGSFFELYNRYGFTIKTINGEYPGKALGGEMQHAKEFIAPPLMWAIEANSQAAVNYFQAEHISRNDVLEAFQTDLPDSKGTGVLSPPFTKPYQVIGKALIAVVILLAVHLILTIRTENAPVLFKYYALPDTPTAPYPVFVTDTFLLSHWRNNLELTTEVEVSNSWFSVDYEIVNAKTGEEYGLSQEVSYYYGYEDGESWSEGGKQTSDVVHSLPAGKYFIRVQPQRPEVTPTARTFQLNVVRNVSIHSNFVLLLLLLLIWPTIAYILAYRHDKNRWYNSDFTHYNYE